MAVAAHSLLQLLISITRLLKKSPVIPSRNYAWLIFAGDQVSKNKPHPSIHPCHFHRYIYGFFFLVESVHYVFF